MLEKIQHNEPKMPELVMTAILNAMEAGTLKIGDALPSERDLSELLGVGRGSLRESLAVLEFLGVISTSGNRKFIRRDACHVRNAMSFVHLANDDETLVDFLEFRLINETMVAKLACKRATTEDIENLHETLGRLEQDNNDNAAHRDFHQALAQSAHNAPMTVVMDMVNSIMTELRMRNASKPGYMPGTVEDHREILNSIEARDEDRADKAIRHHLANIAEFCDLENADLFKSID